MKPTDLRPSPRRLSSVSLICLVIGNMIGTGVYVSSGYSIASLGDARYVLLVWLIAGVHAICGAIAYAAVADRLSVSGGEYAILSRWVHPFVGFLAAWISIIAGFAAPIAANALLIGSYTNLLLSPLGVNFEFLQPWLATAAIMAAALLRILEFRWSAWTNNYIIAIKLSVLALFVVLGVFWILRHGSDGVFEKEEPFASQYGLFAAMLGSMYFVALSYTGFNASIYLAGDYPRKPEELKHDESALQVRLESTTSRGPVQYESGASRVVGLSMILACVIVTGFYLLLNFVFLYSIPASEVVAAGEAFVPRVANALGGPVLQLLMVGVILLSNVTSVLAMTITGPHVYLQVGKDLGLISDDTDKRSSPLLIAISIQAGLAILFVWMSSMKELITYLGLTLTACGAMAIGSIWIAKWKLGNRFSPMTGLQHIAAAVYVAGASVLFLLGFYYVKTQFLSTVFTFGLGALVYFVLKGYSSRLGRRT